MLKTSWKEIEVALKILKEKQNVNNILDTFVAGKSKTLGNVQFIFQ